MWPRTLRRAGLARSQQSSLSISTGAPATSVRAPASIRAGVVSRVGEERRRGAALLAGLADRTGLDVHGCGGPLTARPFLVWRSARSLPLPPLAPSRRARVPICAGIGPIRRGSAVIGTIAEN